MKVLVTGGAGFIGSHLVHRFVEAGHNVVVVDNLSAGKQKNIHPKARFYKVDITGSGLRRVFEKEKPEVVSHHAAQAGVRQSIEDPLFDARVNILGTINLLQECIVANVRQIIFASSGGAIYRESKTAPPSERGVVKPLSAYGIGKFSSDLYLRYFWHIYRLNYVSFRYANVYGPRQDPSGEAGVVAIFAEKLLQGKSPVINGTGKQTRDFVYIDDVVEANYQAFHAKARGIFNVGTGKETSINQIFRHTAGCIDSMIKPSFGPAKQGEVMRSVLDASRIRRTLSWKPKVSIKEGLRRTVDSFKAERTR
ncbi:MAG: UDP-glucose 4-epimerase [Nitrospiraceae bacterium]|nr:UDP-glucose 4-epimerase [Nitrospiraceae bacterium]|tara:strand:- start:1077 stop:2003 length:927 start_codon:yes stop_codon:yes gene_type:complete